MQIKIAEIFESIDGEVNGFKGIGQLSTFIRFGGCNLNCTWCDTLDAKHKDKRYSYLTAENILKKCIFPKITITGGEPLYQDKELKILTEEALKLNKDITVETNGSYKIPINPDWTKLRYIVDYKLPSSNFNTRMNIANYENLCSQDIIKFVIYDDNDYNIAIKTMGEIIITFPQINTFALSPILENSLDFTIFMEKIREDKIYFINKNIIINVQLHKLVGGIR